MSGSQSSMRRKPKIMYPRRKRAAFLGSIVLEAALIVFGVLVALSFDAWRSARDEQRQVRQALQLISQEMQSNREVLEARVTYYLAMSDTIGRVIERRAVSVSDSIAGWRGLQPPLLRDASYRAALATQAFSRMDLATASKLAEVYTFQDLYVKLLERAVDAMLDSNEESLREVRNRLRELGQIGRELVEVYADGLAIPAVAAAREAR